MPTPYRTLFALPGAARLTFASFIARMALPMCGIGIITMLSQSRGGYALAGAVAATFVFTYAICAPQISRLVDRHGQKRILPLAVGISACGIFALLLCAYLQAPNWALFVTAIIAGTMPSMSAMTRARWTQAYKDQPELQTAYSLETVLDELSFISGPPLSVGLCIGVFPEAGPMVAALLLVVGVALFMTIPEAANGASNAVRRSARPVVLRPAVAVLTLLMVAMGVVVGTVDIGSVAFAEELGQPAAASVVLSAYALGSCVAGLVFGALKLTIALPRLLLFTGAATALATLPLLAVENITGLSLMVLVAGVFFAPTMIVAMALVERIVPAFQLTEGLTWLLAGLNTGTAIGAALSGQIVDLYGVQAGFGVAVTAGGAILVLSVICLGINIRVSGKGERLAT